MDDNDRNANADSSRQRLKIGLALGSGSARGWAHIGIIRALEELGIRPDIICGTSIGALVGAAYVSGNLDRLEQWVRSLTRIQTVRFFEINRSFSGFVNRERLHRFLNRNLCEDELLIEECPQAYAAVATELRSGREVWLRDGPLIGAVWASISLPGLFPAIRHRQHWLVDGGLVNPVPVSVCRALDADIVIAVNLNDDLVGRHLERQSPVRPRTAPDERARQSGSANSIQEKSLRLLDRVREYTGSLFAGNAEEGPPGLFDSIAASLNIIQDRITRSRLAGDPADLVLKPRLADIALLEFYRANESIETGRRCVAENRDELLRLSRQYSGPGRHGRPALPYY